MRIILKFLRAVLKFPMKNKAMDQFKGDYFVNVKENQYLRFTFSFQIAENATTTDVENKVHETICNQLRWSLTKVEPSQK